MSIMSKSRSCLLFLTDSDLDDVGTVVGHFLLGHAVHRTKGGKVDWPPLRQLFQHLAPQDVVRGDSQARSNIRP